MEEDILSERETLISNDHSNEEWQEFEDKLEVLEAEELTGIADYLGLKFSDDWEWQEFRDIFEGETWKDFIRAYEKVTYQQY